MASSAVDCHSSQRPQIRCWRSHREADTLAVVVAVAVVVPANKRRRRLLGTPWAENAFSRVAAVQSHTKLVRACTVHAPERVVKSSQVKSSKASFSSQLCPPLSLPESSQLLQYRALPAASARTFQQSSTHIEVITSDSLKAPGPCPGRIPLALPLASPQMVRQSSCTGTVEYSRSELMARAPV